MASSSRLVLFATILLLSSSTFCTAEDSKVPLALYYETLCPFCSKFIVNDLANIFDNGIISIVDLDLVPYGNARLGSNGTITCQHGKYECLLNTVQACAMHIWPDKNDHFKFINCIEKLAMDRHYLEWETCFSTDEHRQAVKECSINGTGHRLDLENEKKTDTLKPRHEYVPWVVVNGEPLKENYKYFQVEVCKVYKGENRPKVCDESDDSLLKISEKKKSSNGASRQSEISLPDAMKIKMVDN